MANKKQSGFGKWASSRKGQQVIICAAFAIIPLLLLLVFTYIPFGEMVKFSFYKQIISMYSQEKTVSVH